MERPLRKGESQTNSERILKILQDMGLAENEARVYSTLLSSGSMVAGDLMRNTSLRQPQLYDITASLERKGFVNIIDGRPKRYEAVPGEVVLDRREKVIQENRKLFLLWAKERNSNSYVSPALVHARNFTSVINNSVSIISRAKSYLFVEATPELLYDLMDDLRLAIARGVRTILLLYGETNFQELMNRDRRLDSFHDIRLASMGQIYSVIADESLSVFMPRNVSFSVDGDRYGYIFRDRDMTWFLVHNFFSAWYSSKVVRKREQNLEGVYTSQRLAVNDMASMSDKIMSPRVKLEGFWRKDRRIVDMECNVTGINLTPDVVNFTVQDEHGKYTVGGYDAMIEDIEMTKLTIERHSA